MAQHVNLECDGKTVLRETFPHSRRLTGFTRCRKTQFRAFADIDVSSPQSCKNPFFASLVSKYPGHHLPELLVVVKGIMRIRPCDTNNPIT